MKEDKWECAVCRAQDVAGGGRWARPVTLDTTPVCRGACFHEYQKRQQAFYIRRVHSGVLSDICVERARQTVKWGARPIPKGKELTVLVEEVGEVARAMQGDGNLDDELVQVAAVCTRWLEAIRGAAAE